MRHVPTAVVRPARALAIAAIVAGVLSACQERSAPAAAETAALDGALQRDLALAASAGTELARPADAGRTRFVSAIERGEAPSAAPAPRAPERARSRAARPSPRRAPETRVAARPRPAAEPAPEAQAEAAVAAAEPTVEVMTAGPADDAGATPASAPAPAPTTVAAEPGNDEAPDPGPADGRGVGRTGSGGGWGGVVIRGGGVGDVDHCERDFPTRRRGGVMIGRRYPGDFPGGMGPVIGGMRVGGRIMRAGTVVRSSPMGVLRGTSAGVLRGGAAGVLRGRP